MEKSDVQGKNSPSGCPTGGSTKLGTSKRPRGSAPTDEAGLRSGLTPEEKTSKTTGASKPGATGSLKVKDSVQSRKGAVERGDGGTSQISPEEEAMLVDSEGENSTGVSEAIGDLSVAEVEALT
jgi:hypothetical protein